MKKYCSKCGKELPEDSKTPAICPTCGVTSVTTTSKAPVRLWQLFFIFLCGTGLIFAGLLQSNFQNKIYLLFIGFMSILAVVNHIMKLGLEIGGSRRTAGAILYLGTIIIIATYGVFTESHILYMGIVIFIVLAGLALFSRYSNMIQKYTVFRERRLVISAIIILILAILIDLIIRI